MENEIPTTEIPGSQVPPPDQTRPNVPAPPPATNLVVKGDIKSERELEIERRSVEIEERLRAVKDVEINLSAKELAIQKREEALRDAPTPTPKKEKRRHFLSPLINTQRGDE